MQHDNADGTAELDENTVEPNDDGRVFFATGVVGD